MCARRAPPSKRLRCDLRLQSRPWQLAPLFEQSQSAPTRSLSTGITDDGEAGRSVTAELHS